jgi:transcriptional regulator with XRE-family HTH domain
MQVLRVLANYLLVVTTQDCAKPDTGLTILYMSDQRPPARPWYDLVTETIALKGWTKAQLADRAGVSRPTVDNWRTNPRPPQARSVNAVADVLGIPRKEALRLAGVIADGDEADRSPPSLLDGAVGGEDAELVRKALREVYPDTAEEILAGIEERLKRRRAGGR